MRNTLSPLALCLTLMACGGNDSSDSNTQPSDLNTDAPNSLDDTTVNTAYASMDAAAQLIHSDVSDDYLGLLFNDNGATNVFSKSSLAVHSEKVGAFSFQPLDDDGLFDSDLRNGLFIVEGECGGELELAVDGIPSAATEGSFPYEFEMVAEFSDYCESDFDYESDKTIINGSIIVEMALDSDTQVDVFMEIDLDVSEFIDNEVYSASVFMDLACSMSETEKECQFSTEITDENGTTFSLSADVMSHDMDTSHVTLTSQLAISSDNTTTQYEVEIDGVNADYCDNGNLSGGSLTIKDENEGDIQLDFTDCDHFTITHNGLSEVFPQSKSG